MEEKKKRPPQKVVPGYKSENQKYKSLLVMQYILKHADDEHPVTIGDIEGHLLECRIGDELHSFCIKTRIRDACHGDFSRNDMLPGLFCYDVCDINTFSYKVGIILTSSGFPQQ